MADPHLAAITAGVTANRQLKTLFSRKIGTKAEPRGEILAAYSRTRQGLVDNLDNPIVVAALLDEYRAAVLDATAAGLVDASSIGYEQAIALADAWDLQIAREFQPGISGVALAAVLGIVDNQIRSIQSGLLTEAMILGGRNRVGLFAPGVIQREAANQMANIAAVVQENIMTASLSSTGAYSDFVRQAVAAIDEKTTPCCLGVHGQIRELKEPFYTPDPPAYSDQQDRHPFHDHCRTSVVLVARQFGRDDLTERMLRAATLEGVLRGRPGYVAPHPADAFTRTTG
jgi:hypothetical protein